MQRRFFLQALAWTSVTTPLLLAAGQAGAQQALLIEGRTFLRTPNTSAPPAGKIEVVEFFSYGCPHCSSFEPELAAWLAKLPPDVAFRRVPVPFLANAENYQRTYFALDALGLVATMQPKIFAAVHVERRNLSKPEDIAALVASHGGDGPKFLAAFRSFSVDAALRAAKKLTSEYGVDTGPGVPALVVQGRYLTSPGQAGGGARALAVVDALIERARKG